jgi:acetoin:2,6-dichlorophenolindophenol oxidoreductase subunit beta
LTSHPDSACFNIGRPKVYDRVSAEDVYEGVKTLGIGAEISAIVAESEASNYLDAPHIRLGGVEARILYSLVLEKAAALQVEDIVAAARRLGQHEV